MRGFIHQIVHTYFQGIRPIGDTDSERFFHLRLVKHRECWTFHLAWEFVTVTGLDITILMAGQFCNHLRKVEP